MRRNGVVITVLLALVLAACGDDGDGDDAAAPEPTEAEATTTEADVALDEEAVLRYGYRVDVTRFDPHRATSAYDNQWLNHVYDRLIHLDEDNQLVPGLAEDWSFDDDGEVLELELREGVVFHDGTPFDAEAVRANIERAQTLEDSSVAAELAIVSEVEVVDEMTVRLRLSEVSSAFPAVLSDRAGMMVSPAAFGNADLAERPVGAGMYRVRDYTPGDRATYERFEEHWDPGAARLAGIEGLVMTDSTTRMNALRSGQVDAAEIDPSQIEEAEGAGLKVEADVTMEFFHIQMNRTASEFGDVRVRKALNHAIDREALVTSHGYGAGVVTDQPFPPGYFAHAEDIGPLLHDYDPERARTLLAEAGLADGFTFDAMVPNFPERIALAEIVQSNLAEVGVEMTISVVEGVQLSERFYGQGLGDTIFSRWTGRADPLQTIGLLYTPGAVQNPGAHTTDEVQALYEEALAVVDRDDREDAVQELVAQVTEDAMGIILYVPDQILAMSEDVVGLRPWLSGKPELRGVGIAG